MQATSGVLTIGHSTHALAVFVDLLNRNGVSAVADVRAAPYSRFNPQFNREFQKHLPALAPTKQMLDDYKKNGGEWSTYLRYTGSRSVNIG